MYGLLRNNPPHLWISLGYVDVDVDVDVDVVDLICQDYPILIQSIRSPN
jgi:hypothetical protein